MSRISGTELGFSFDILTLGLVMAVAAALRVFPSLWDKTVGPADKSRIHTLDGARGLLTMWVLAHHLLGGSFVDAKGVWHPPAGALGVLLASGFFIAPFFMLTAMLFGGRLLTRPGQIDILRLVITRTFRLVPVYALAVLILIVGVFVTTRFTLQQPAGKIVKEIVRWMLFDFIERYDINGVDIQKHYGVLWTLRYEVLFYAALPLLALVQRITKGTYIIIPALALAGLYSWPFIYFSAGTTAALCTHFSGKLARRGWQAAAICGIAIICSTASYGISSNWVQAICLIPTFVCLALELPLFKPIAWRPFRLIGEASYSNYVLHGAVLFILSVMAIDASSILAQPFWTRMAGLLVFASASLALSLASYCFIERPFIRLGAALALRVDTRSTEGVRSPRRLC